MDKVSGEMYPSESLPSFLVCWFCGEEDQQVVQGKIARYHERCLLAYTPPPARNITNQY